MSESPANDNTPDLPPPPLTDVPEEHERPKLWHGCLLALGSLVMAAVLPIIAFRLTPLGKLGSNSLINLAFGVLYSALFAILITVGVLIMYVWWAHPRRRQAAKAPRPGCGPR